MIGVEERLVMYLHGGSGNHGCEAIVNSTCHMLGDIPKLLVTHNRAEDEAYSLASLCDILEENDMERHFVAHVCYYLWRAVTHDAESFMRYRFRGVLGRNRAPLYLSVGGDMYCYETTRKEAVLANRTFHKSGAATVLWGCSIEPELLREPEIIEDMKRYTLITPRESITLEALREAGITGNVKYFPDPAFALEPEETELPARFAAGKTIGINISPMIVQYEQKDGIALDNYRRLIDHILRDTDNCVALIPHVMWRNNDDRITLKELYRGYEGNGRVMLFPDMSCRRLKYIISQCRAFIGARTHATIAAYSSLVPTLVVGYSVKARGIARDLFGEEKHYVLPVQALEDAEELIQAFDWMMRHEQQIAKRLREKMPSYCALAQEAGGELRKIWQERK